LRVINAKQNLVTQIDPGLFSQPHRFSAEVHAFGIASPTRNAHRLAKTLMFGIGAVNELGPVQVVPS
jgi:hypothetical protein